MAKRPRKTSSGLGESVSRFDRDAPSLDTYLALAAQVVAAYGNRCAVTGSDRRDPLSVVAIRPRELGGPLHVRNCLPLIPAAAAAFAAGHFTIGIEYELITDQSRIDPELGEMLNVIGRLILPEDPAYLPAPAHLRFHREHLFPAFAGQSRFLE